MYGFWEVSIWKDAKTRANKFKNWFKTEILFCALLNVFTQIRLNDKWSQLCQKELSAILYHFHVALWILYLDQGEPPSLDGIVNVHILPTKQWLSLPAHIYLHCTFWIHNGIWVHLKALYLPKRHLKSYKFSISQLSNMRHLSVCLFLPEEAGTWLAWIYCQQTLGPS